MAVDGNRLSFQRLNKNYMILVCVCLGLSLLLFSNYGTGNNPTTTTKSHPTKHSLFHFSDKPGKTIPLTKISVVNTLSHDPGHFTQGFEIVDGVLYEGTGMHGESKLMKKDLKTGKILESVELDKEYFGEGVTLFGDFIYQLTWKNHIGFIYDTKSFAKVGSWKYNYDGWGLTHDDKYLIVTDGSSTIRFLDPSNLEKPVKLIRALYPDGKEQVALNELEYIDGMIWANVWMSDVIVVILPSTGHIVAKINLSGMRKQSELGGDVLNGIAFDKDTGKVYVTGKYWKHVYEIEPLKRKK
jgi:glutamine cyclotransferase